VLNRAVAQTALGRDIVGALAGYGLPILPVRLGQRVLYPESAAAGLAVIEANPRSAAACEMIALAACVQRGDGTAVVQSADAPGLSPWREAGAGAARHMST